MSHSTGKSSTNEIRKCVATSPIFAISHSTEHGRSFTPTIKNLQPQNKEDFVEELCLLQPRTMSEEQESDDHGDGGDYAALAVDGKCGLK